MTRARRFFWPCQQDARVLSDMRCSDRTTVVAAILIAAVIPFLVILYVAGNIGNAAIS